MDAIERLTAREEITDRLHAYARWTDLNRPDEFLKLFHQDCRVNYVRGDQWREGRDGLFEYLGGALKQVSATYTTVSNVEIRFESDDRAGAHHYQSTWHRFKEDRPDWLAMGFCADAFVREGDEWLIIERRFTIAGGVGKRSYDYLEPIGRAD